ncbi:hypothetical protein CANARDRAFT_28656 [[Candida] arabinofermentans NRRL YB-2248]|uniref:Needs CLA4 to survive protein 3 n=1 Tax=[Candida] arabinofermentans NRRL YB-2248 TaxID=983967 RepID=A0A1E4SZJ1_9ASCO|nr:hypothetical protein CANARDRAFT_28656 [[Candida] arabinofermentans NRRL YB-2248]
MDYTTEELLQQIQELKLENESLKNKLDQPIQDEDPLEQSTKYPFTLEEYKRYGRQLLVPEFGGPESQLRLKKSKVLVIGAGGLGSPALLYLAGIGLGEIGIVDHDTVSISNLHRQVIHSTRTIGELKCESAKHQMLGIEPRLKIRTFQEGFNSINSFEIMNGYDIVLDCTDNPATRYLINDVAVLLGITVVSGSGLKTEGQLSVLNYMGSGPCYRCFYPTPPLPSSVTSCSDGGVLGSCIGVIGVMMVTECIKVLTGWYERKEKGFIPFLSLYHGYNEIGQSLRSFKMRGRRKGCVACDLENRSITREIIESGELDYGLWCGKVDYSVLNDDDKVDVQFLSDVLSKQKDDKNPILDVREKEQFDIVHLDGSINLPLRKLTNSTKEVPIDDLLKGYDSTLPLYVVCRLGNDSQLAVKYLKEEFGLQNVYDVKGGLNAWASIIDNEFPTY